MMQHIKMMSHKAPVIGTFREWNTRTDILKFAGLDEKYTVYEIAFGNKLFFYFLSLLNSIDTGVSVVTHASDIENELTSKYVAYDLPNIRPLYIHAATIHNGKQFSIILADYLMHTVGKIAPFIFVCLSKALGNINDILEYIEATKNTEEYKQINRKIFIYTVKPLSPFDVVWEICNPIQYRNIDTVYIESKIKNEVIEDINSFLSETTETLYRETGIPYKKCFLFYGLPGTGKTSFVRALASLLNKNICILKLKSQFLNDHSLYLLAQTIPTNSILLIDDIDSTFTSEHSGACDMGRVSLSGLLDLLDGISSYNKQLIFITCNQTNVFNKVLMRPGRIDRIIEFKALSREPAKNMLSKFRKNANVADIDKLASLIETVGKITPAELQTILLENTGDISDLHRKFEALHSNISNQYTNLTTKCDQLYQNHYGDLYGYGNSLYL